jgi:hypothetical protein
MNAETVSDAVAAVYQALRSLSGAQVMDHVPAPGNVASPVVIIDRNGLVFNEMDYRVPVRIYVAASRHGTVRDAQHVFDDVLDGVEGLLADVSVQSTGRVAYLEASDVWLGDMQVTVSRI